MTIIILCIINTIFCLIGTVISIRVIIKINKLEKGIVENRNKN